MLDMGDFAGGLLKYLAKHPVERLTIGGGFAKMTKLAQGAVDLHSGRSQVDFAGLADWAGDDRVAGMNTAMEAVEAVPALGQQVAERARDAARRIAPEVSIDTVVVARDGRVLGVAE